MSNRNLVLRSPSYCLSAALLVAVATASTSALADPADPINPLQKRFLTGKALDICDQGSFFVGGAPKYRPSAHRDRSSSARCIRSSRSPLSVASGHLFSSTAVRA